MSIIEQISLAKSNKINKQAQDALNVKIDMLNKTFEEKALQQDLLYSDLLKRTYSI